MPPSNIKIYHIVHVDRLPSIVNDKYLWCDAEIVKRMPPGTTIGMNHIKDRRLHRLRLSSYPDLFVGDCVPFYFCPRSVMLYLIYQANHPNLDYHDGQDPIIHLEADLLATINWARENNKRWAFTLSNAATKYFEDRCDLFNLDEINWKAVQSDRWSGVGVEPSIKEGKQAEFLLEQMFPWFLIERIGVASQSIYQQTTTILTSSSYKPRVEILPAWYY